MPKQELDRIIKQAEKDPTLIAMTISNAYDLGRIDEKETKRTTKQNSALHLFFTLLADELNTAGLGMREVLKTEIYIEWNTESVKKYLWKPFMFRLTGKEHTSDLEKHEIDKIYEHLNLYLAENPKTCGLSHIPFPSKPKDEPKDIEYPGEPEIITAF